MDAVKFGKLLNAGNAALVYRGTYRDKKVILKALKGDHCHPKGLAAFQYEFDIAVSVAGDGIVKPIDYVFIDGAPVQIYEDNDATSLREIMLSRRLRPAEVLTVGHQVALSLQRIHHGKIIHKDINPQNIVANFETNYVAVIDFGISTKLSRESQALDSANQLEGTCAYMSPEQTGRTSRSIDYRSDFFSLGAALYEVLTGKEAFTGKDPAEVIHQILASDPPSPNELDSSIPLPLSKIIMKLMCKDPEGRYQSGFGLAHDFARCLQGLDKSGRIQAFEIGEADVSEKFEISERLYGRERDIAALLGVFARVAGGANELVLLGGPSGIGKTALVHQLRKPMTERQGFYASGKFDQFQRNIPYSAVAQALNQLIRITLALNPVELESLKDRVKVAVGDLGQVLVEIVPTLENLIGKQPPAPALDPEKSKHRLRFLVERFMRAIASEQHPITIFLDDMQWADSGSLEILQILVQERGPSHLLVIAAYRDNEVNPSHAFVVAVDSMKKENVIVSAIEVGPLTMQDTLELVSDTMKCDRAKAEALATIAFKKTLGNAFFIKTFLTFLHQHELINYSSEAKGWVWDIAAIKDLNVTENVVELLSHKLREFGVDTCRALMCAACIGPKFDLKTLSHFVKRSLADVALSLWPATEEGLLIPIGDEYKYATSVGRNAINDESLSGLKYRFSHDRIQQAAHELLAEDQRGATHYAIGKLLIASLTDAERKERVFEIVDHLNYHLDALPSTDEELLVSTLNREAGVQAQVAGAYQAAIPYFETSLRLLGGSPWSRDVEASKVIFAGLARAYNSTGEFEKAQEVVLALIKNSSDPVEKANAYALQAVLFEARGMNESVLKACIEGCAVLGVRLPLHISLPRIGYEAVKLKIFWNESVFAKIEKSEDISDPKWTAIINLAVTAFPVAYISNANFCVFITIRVFRLAYARGTAINDPTFLLMLALIMVLLKDHRLATRLRDLGKRIKAQRKTPSLDSLNMLVSGHWVDIIDKDPKECIKVEENGFQTGLMEGMLQNAGSGAFLCLYNGLCGGGNLADQLITGAKYESFFARRQDNYSYSLFYSTLQTIRCFLGQTKTEVSFSDENIDESTIAEKAKISDGNTSIFHVHKMWLHFFHGNYAKVLEHGDQSKALLSLPGCFSGAYHLLFISIAMFRLLRQSEHPRPNRVKALLLTQIARFELMWWNVSHRIYCTGLYELFMAEYSLFKRQDERAVAFYEKALEIFRRNGNLPFAGVAHEQLGRLYFSKGRDVPAKAHLLQAGEFYFRWGFSGKVATLQEEFGLGGGESEQTNPLRATSRSRSMARSTMDGGTRFSTSSAGNIDLETILKASQAISGQIDYSKLLEDLLRIILENAGADYGVMLLGDQAACSVRVVGEMKRSIFSATLRNEGLQANSPIVANKIVQVVMHTRETIVLNDVQRENEFTAEVRIRDRAPKSLICSPIITQGNLLGVLYLENSLASSAFTPDRVKTLSLLAAQGAISLKNAGFVQDISQSAKEILALKGQLEKILAGTKEMSASKSKRQAVETTFAYIADESAAFKASDCAYLVKETGSDSLRLLRILQNGRTIEGQDFQALDDSPMGASLRAAWTLRQPTMISIDMLAVPLVWNEETVAVLLLSGISAKGIQSRDLDFIATLSQSLALSLVNLDHQENLTMLVQERTKNLNIALSQVDEKRQKIQTIMDQIDQGILTFGAGLKIDQEFSAFASKFLHKTEKEIVDQDVFEVILNNADVSSDSLKMMSEVLTLVIGEDKLNWEINEGLLPNEIPFVIAGERKIVSMDWKPMLSPSGEVTRMMLTFRDISERRLLEEKLKIQADIQSVKMAALSEMIENDRHDLSSFLRAHRPWVEKAAANAQDLGSDELELMKQELHSTKGEARYLGLSKIAELAHFAEESIKAQATGAADNAAARLCAQIVFYRELFDEIFGSEDDSSDSWSLYSLGSIQMPIVRKSLAVSGFDLESFLVEDRIGLWSKNGQRAVKTMLVHAINNVIDHGFVLPRKSGVTVTNRPEIKVTAMPPDKQGVVKIAVCDNGAGLNLEKLRAIARERSTALSGPIQPEEVPFLAGTSTATAVTLTSGRGVGLSAVRQLARDLGGDVTIANRIEGGTQLLITLPAEAVYEQSEALRSAS